MRLTKFRTLPLVTGWLHYSAPSGEPIRGSRIWICRWLKPMVEHTLIKGACESVSRLTRARDIDEQKEGYQASTVIAAISTDIKSSLCFCDMFNFTDDDGRTRPHETNVRLLCGILSGSRSRFIIIKNSNCCLITMRLKCSASNKNTT